MSFGSDEVNFLVYRYLQESGTCSEMLEKQSNGIIDKIWHFSSVKVLFVIVKYAVYHLDMCTNLATFKTQRLFKK